MKIQFACGTILAASAIAATGLVSAQQVDSTGALHATIVYTVHGEAAKSHLRPIMDALNREVASSDDAASTAALEVLAHLQKQALSSSNSIYTYSTSVASNGSVNTQLMPFSGNGEPVPGQTQTITTCTPSASGYALNTSISQVYTDLGNGVMGWETYATRTWRTSTCPTSGA